MTIPRNLITGAVSMLIMALAVPCLALACPPYNIRVLAFAGLALCCYSSTLFRRGLYPAGLGLAVGLLMGMTVVGYKADYTAYANMLPIFGTVGVNIAATCWVVCWANRRLSPKINWWLIPTAAAAIEYLGTNLFPVSLALTQHTSAWACQLAAVTGQWGITWVLWFGASALVFGAINRQRCLLAAGVALFVMTSLPITPTPVSVPGTIGVAAIQAPGERTAAEITMKLPASVSYVVWPEQVQLDHDPTTRQAAMRSHKYVIGSFERELSTRKSTNSARLFSPSGVAVLVTDKRHLFGKEVLQYRKGVPSQAVDVGQGVRVAVPICFDMIYPDVARRLVKGGANLLMSPNSDPDSPTNSFHRLHLAIVRLRAAENRVPIVWSEVSSYSSIIDASGAVLKQAPASSEAAVVAMIRVADQKTIYTRFGDWFAVLCLIATLGLIGSQLTITAQRALKWANDLKLK